ncbi:non-structural maintenance of chromosomes element 4 homolog A [Hemicordylus capensis]|uniref:non-structural maintenance of chromosomes element 4 homolog A n=1 Tax=Hemicordylus capensis TaxID=884348 RepID=UPI002302B0B3|nr:non-structural maintenance of chromosomes element 4 homolog A [Hemicordylus capensis]XP_053165046.1 non-structural maintenance of chromosomes element 4 homolog A [Hemicordylus capensis]
MSGAGGSGSSRRPRQATTEGAARSHARRHPPQEAQAGGGGDAGRESEEEPERGRGEREENGPGPSGEDGGDETTRRLIRQQYRELISTVQQNREMMLSTRNDKLTEALEDANKLFTGVSRAREAALDAQFLVLASNLGKEKANQLHSDMAVFDPSAFAEDLLSFMGLNRLEGEDSDSDDEHIAAGFLPSNAWHILGEEARKYFRRAPTFHFMLGAFTADPPVERPRIERQRKRAGPDEGRAMPAQLKKMEESNQEATEKEVERILGLLQAYCQEDPDTPLSFLEFVTDPNSFARTIENMFHVSFLIRDGLARLSLDQDKLPVIASLNPEEGENDLDTQARKQAVISMSYQEWQNIVRIFEISEPMIPPIMQT